MIYIENPFLSKILFRQGGNNLFQFKSTVWGTNSLSNYVNRSINYIDNQILTKDLYRKGIAHVFQFKSIVWGTECLSKDSTIWHDAYV